MQFHLNGFRPGDPSIADDVAAFPPDVPHRSLPDEVDVLIVGSGPTGLVVATQLAAFADVSVCLIEQKPGPLRLGQADGIACRSLEMFNAFGFADKVLRESYWVNETVFWKPDPDDERRISRSGRIQDVEDGLSEFPHVILNQARVHDFFLERMRHSPTTLVPDYGRRLIDLDRPAGDDEPIVARIERTDSGHEGEIETVRARYVVGCDGARSTVRRSMGLELRGDAANQAWGVMDVLAITDFPDIRFKAVVQSAGEGNLLVIPREGGYLVRLYIELDKLDEGERASNRNITLDHLIDAARRIFAPYTLDVKEVPWWSVYEIGQRLTTSYDDASLDGRDPQPPRIFIAGDACHTHSPKAGQGMNVSMRDGFNLGWKLAAVLRGRSDPAILGTYSSERRAVAQELIDFDREFARMFSAGADPAAFQQHFEQAGRFTAGTATHYGPGLLVGGNTHQHLAAGFVVGTRFHSAPVVRLADGRPMHLGHVVEADGRWRLFAFGDDRPVGAEGSLLAGFCSFLSDDPRSPVVRFTQAGDNIDGLIDVRAVVQQHHGDLSIEDVPPLLRPTKGALGLVDYEKVFCPDLKDGPDVFDQRGIDRSLGAVVIARPDQHVAAVLPLDDHDGLAAFFDRFLLTPEDVDSEGSRP